MNTNNQNLSAADIKSDLPTGGILGQGNHHIDLSPVARLLPNPHNARRHTKRQVRLIADSIKSFGFNNPVLIDDKGVIIAGHGRVQAAKLLGLVAVPTLRLAHLSPAEKGAYVLADNKLAELAGWDPEILAIELQALIDVDFPVELTGFAMGEIDIILDNAAEARGVTDRPEDKIPAPAPSQTVTEPGDLWILGDHRLLCGDARDAGTYEQLLEGEKAQLVFSDPPFNVPVDGHGCGKGDIHHPDFAMASGEMTPQAFTGFLQTIFERLTTNTVDGSIHFACMDWRHITEMMAAGTAVYSELKNLCVWAKTNAGMGTFYRSQHELVFVWKSGTAPHINNFELGQHGRNRTNIWTYPGISGMRAGRLEDLAAHPTIKPTAMLADAIKDCSRRNDLVLDPFAGSGTTLIAAERTGRRARAIEIDPTYVDVAIRRWQAFTGKSATVAGTGQPFDEFEDDEEGEERASGNTQKLAAPPFNTRSGAA